MSSGSFSRPGLPSAGCASAPAALPKHDALPMSSQYPSPAALPRPPAMSEKTPGGAFPLQKISALFPSLLLVCLGTLGCLWLWRRTGELLVDFGNELYVAWQLSQGRVLYRDVAYVYGPLPPYLNAFLMRLFGPRLEVILLANAAVLAIVVVLLYRVLRNIAGTLPALTATSLFLIYFAFSCAARITNYNFLTPYSHAMTQGFALCLGIVFCLDRFARSGSMRSVATGGFLTGLAFLTKPEICLAATAALGFGLAAAIWVRRSRAPRSNRSDRAVCCDRAAADCAGPAVAGHVAASSAGRRAGRVAVRACAVCRRRAVLHRDSRHRPCRPESSATVLLRRPLRDDPHRAGRQPAGSAENCAPGPALWRCSGLRSRSRRLLRHPFRRRERSRLLVKCRSRPARFSPPWRSSGQGSTFCAAAAIPHQTPAPCCNGRWRPVALPAGQNVSQRPHVSIRLRPGRPVRDACW